MWRLGFLIVAFSLVAVPSISEALPVGTAPQIFNKIDAYTMNRLECNNSITDPAASISSACGSPNASYNIYTNGGTAPVMESRTGALSEGDGSGGNAYALADQQYRFYINSEAAIPFDSVPLLISYYMEVDASSPFGDKYASANASASFYTSIWTAGNVRYNYQDLIRASGNSTVYPSADSSSNTLHLDVAVDMWNVIRIGAMSNAGVGGNLYSGVRESYARAFVDPIVMIDPSWEYAGFYSVVQETVAPPVGNAAVVPEPSTLLLLGGGMGALATVRRFKKK